MTQGASILGHVFFPASPVKTGTVSDFEIGLFIGTGHYVFDASGGNDIVTLTNGLISAIDAALPSGPCITGSTAIYPGVIYSGAEFFTDAPTACSPGAVCGTLDFADSAPGPSPSAPRSSSSPPASWVGLPPRRDDRRRELRPVWA